MSSFTIIPAVETIEGQDARVKRLFPTPFLKHNDPFVVMDEFFIDPGAGIPTHPHRGFEAVTYLLEGTFNHKDNIGNDTIVHAGGIQRFTAGKGLEHSEMPASAEMSHGIQLWINLPFEQKHCEPGYQQVDSPEIPEEIIPGGIVRTILGRESPVKLLSDVRLLFVTLVTGKNHVFEIDDRHQGLVFQLSGNSQIADQEVETHNALIFSNIASLNIGATSEGLNSFILLSGLPHNYPIRQVGPFVM